jgi:ATP-dependent DNA helicase RecG
VLRDDELIAQAREAATELVANDRALNANPALARAVAGLIDDEQAEFLERS